MRLFKENGNKNVSLLDSPRPLIFIGHVTKYYVVLKNSLKGICAFQIELEFGNVGFWGEGKTVVPGEKPLEAKERTNNKLNPHMASTPGFEPGSHWWKANALTTAPPLLPQGHKFPCAHRDPCVGSVLAIKTLRGLPLVRVEIYVLMPLFTLFLL